SWIERTGGDVAQVRARRVTRTGASSEPRIIATSSAARASGVPRMVLNGSEIYFAWTVPTKPSTIRVARASTADFR
ncbi:MAG: hypothetical protein ABIR92_00640, partial [Gemmatimonadaceae bacterium]